MVLDNLGGSLQDTLQKLKGKKRIDEEAVNEIVKEIQRALFKADVPTALVQDLSESIRERALDEDPPAGTTARDHVLRIVYEELVDFIGTSVDIPLDKQTILLAGLQGSGKTTSAAKIAWWFSKKGLKPAVIQTDTFRPGAYEQAKEMTERAEVKFYGDPNCDDPVKIALDGMEETEDADVRIIDTAGRHALEDELIDEIISINQAVQPDHNMLVLDAAIGSGASEQATEFQESIGIESVMLTKMDGTAKGGGALAAINKTDSGIAFLGKGENVDDIERFEPSSFVSRLLGMGDLEQLKERVERAYETEDSTEDDWEPEDMLEGDFTMYDMKKQIDTMNNMGPLDEVLDMIPGMGGGRFDQLMGEQDLEMTQERMRNYTIIMDSMTEEEMENPDCINKQRIQRIARGSGTSPQMVRELLQQYKQTKKMMEQFSGREMEQLQGQLGGRGGGNLPF